MRERENEYRRPGDPGPRAYEERGYERGSGFGGDAIWYRQGYGSDAGPFVGKGPRGYQRSDERIFEEVCERLTADGRIDATSIDVDVLRGVVTLTGSVEDRRQKRLAEEAIENISGVKDIENQLHLPSYGEEKERRDERAEARRDERPEAIGIASADRDREERRDLTRDREERRDLTRERELEGVGIAAGRERISPDMPLSGDFGRTDRTAKPADLEARPDTDRTAQYETSRLEQSRSADVTPVSRTAAAEARTDETTRDTLAPERTDLKTADRTDEREPVGVMRDERDRAADSSAGTRPTEPALESRPAGSVPTTTTARAVAGAGPSGGAGAAPSGAVAPSDTTPQGDGRSELGDGGPRTETREIRLTTGAPVYSNEGEKIGEVAEASGDYFVVHKGLIFASELYIPAEAIVRSDENGVQVNIPKDQVGNYKERPAGAAVS